MTRFLAQIELYGFFILAVGVALFLYAYLWLLARALRTGVLWFLLVLILPVIGGVIFLWRQGRSAKGIITLLLVALLIIATPIAANRLVPWLADFGPFETSEEGNLQLTLTGWKKSDYSMIRGRPDVYMLQMANSDVTDDALQFLEGLPKLEILDLAGTGITDAGLPVLATLPKLKSLHLKLTRISDEGFRKHVLPIRTLMELDVRDTGVTAETFAEWKKGYPGRKGPKVTKTTQDNTR